MTKRKLMLVALSLCMVAILAMGGTLAYLTDTADATNTFTVGDVDITLTEDAWTEEGGGEDQGANAYPGEALPKDPTVTNIGDNPCFVRVKVDGLRQLILHSLSREEIALRTNGVIGALGEGWVEHTDGYYYYTEILYPEAEAGEGKPNATTPLFDHIVIPYDTTNCYDDTPFNIDVIAEAVQAQGALPSFSAVQQMNVEQIAAWFVTCGMDAVADLGDNNIPDPAPETEENNGEA